MRFALQTGSKHQMHSTSWVGMVWVLRVRNPEELWWFIWVGLRWEETAGMKSSKVQCKNCPVMSFSLAKVVMVGKSSINPLRSLESLPALCTVAVCRLVHRLQNKPWKPRSVKVTKNIFRGVWLKADTDLMDNVVYNKICVQFIGRLILIRFYTAVLKLLIQTAELQPPTSNIYLMKTHSTGFLDWCMVHCTGIPCRLNCLL